MQSVPGAISTLVCVSDDRMGEAETLSGEVSISAINFQFFSHRKCLDLILIYLPGLMVSTGNDRILLQSDFADS